MALDLVVLGPHGRPVRSVALNVEVHGELMEAALSRKLACFSRLGDYYQDVEFSPDQLHDLSSEAEAISGPRHWHGTDHSHSR
jgi:hypothetical protein